MAHEPWLWPQRGSLTAVDEARDDCCLESSYLTIRPRCLLLWPRKSVQRDSQKYFNFELAIFFDGTKGSFQSGAVSQDVPAASMAMWEGRDRLASFQILFVDLFYFRPFRSLHIGNLLLRLHKLGSFGPDAAYDDDDDGDDFDENDYFDYSGGDDDAAAATGGSYNFKFIFVDDNEDMDTVSFLWHSVTCNSIDVPYLSENLNNPNQSNVFIILDMINLD